MRISSKGRYGIAVMIRMAQISKNNEYTSIISIAEKLDISKIYLEQIFSLLKKAELVKSIKGSQGGYKLAKTPDKITAGDILRAIEISLFEKTENSVSKDFIEIDKSMEALVWDRIDSAVSKALNSVSLSDLVNEADKYKSSDNYMFYI
ncbi:MAG: Rrf2 family transcriptional regulator [Bacillota bacterium]|nr:Rrf2 family transcriptional regulator [Bacillota bacterium]